MPRKPTTGVSADSKKPAPVIYRIKISLKSSKPPIWRRVEVPNCTLHDLHEVIQAVMPWDSSHLWEFMLSRYNRYGPSSDDTGFDMGLDDCEPASDVTLNQLVARGVKKFEYTYDFGDSWGHTILIEKKSAPEAGAVYPRCTAGKMAGPPEDCGGLYGYYELVETLSNPKHKNHKETKEWHEGTIDPNAFDLDEVNAILRTIEIR